MGEIGENTTDWGDVIWVRWGRGRIDGCHVELVVEKCWQECDSDR